MKILKNRLHFLFKFDIIQKQSKIASVAQQVEQLIRNQQVAGPNPATSSKHPFLPGVFLCLSFYVFYPTCLYIINTEYNLLRKFISVGRARNAHAHARAKNEKSLAEARLFSKGILKNKKGLYVKSAVRDGK